MLDTTCNKPTSATPFQVPSKFKVMDAKSVHLEPLIFDLFTPQEQTEFKDMMERIIRVVEHAVKRGVKLMVDAEQTYLQAAISRIALALMRKYNKDRVQIFNTYQAYLKNALDQITLDMHLAKRDDFKFGCKLVRGAYMDQERKRAATIGYEDPILPDFESTTAMFNACLEKIADEEKIASVVVATHNENTIRYAVEMMKERHMAPSNQSVSFAQVYGMCDQVSYPLGQAGYSIYKYLPYGPVEGVLSYLSNRAQENSAMVAGIAKERTMMWEELKRRMVAGKLFYAPIPNPI